MKWSQIQNNLNSRLKTKKKKKVKSNRITSGFKVKFREQSLKKRTQAETQAKAFMDLRLKENNDYYEEFIFQNRRLDFFVPRLSLAIEIDGGYHKHPEQKKKDDLHDYVFKNKYNISVIRIKNEDVSLKVPELVEKIFSDLNDLMARKKLNTTVKNSLKRMKKIINGDNKRKQRVDRYIQKTILRKAPDTLHPVHLVSKQE